MNVLVLKEPAFQALDDQKSESEVTFQEAMLLVFFLISLAGFLLFSIFLIIYAVQVKMSKVDRFTKVVIAFFMFLNVSELTINAIKYF